MRELRLAMLLELAFTRYCEANPDVFIARRHVLDLAEFFTIYAGVLNEVTAAALLMHLEGRADARG
jgi:hypothetical protein